MWRQEIKKKKIKIEKIKIENIKIEKIKFQKIKFLNFEWSMTISCNNLYKIENEKPKTLKLSHFQALSAPGSTTIEF